MATSAEEKVVKSLDRIIKEVETIRTEMLSETPTRRNNLDFTLKSIEKDAKFLMSLLADFPSRR